MLRRNLPFFIIISLLALPAASFGEDAGRILSKFAASRTDISYTGLQSVVTLSGEKIGAGQYRISRYLSEMERLERLDEKRSVMEVVIDDKKSLFRYLPEKKTVYKDNSNLAGLTPLTLKESIELTRANYEVQLLGKDTVARRECIKVLLKPKNNDRPSRQLCLDAAHGLPLRTEIYDLSGKLVTVSSFSEIAFSPAFPNRHFMLMVPKNTQVIEMQEIPNLTLVSASRLLGAPVALPAYVPPGYVLREVSLIGKEGPFKVQLAYGDGLTTLSIFQNLQKGPLQPQNMRKVSLAGGNEGYLKRYGQTSLLVFNYKNSTVTLIGEVSPEEMAKIAGSFPQ